MVKSSIKLSAWVMIVLLFFGTVLTDIKQAFFEVLVALESEVHSKAALDTTTGGVFGIQIVLYSLQHCIREVL